MGDHQDALEWMRIQIQELSRLLETSKADTMRLRDENEKLRLQMREAKEAMFNKEKEQWAKLQRERKATREKLGIDNVNNFNYAIVGHSGTGKSSLLNALLGLDPTSAGAAKTSVVECTNSLKPYRHKNFKNFVFWDIPGAGTIMHPVETYFEDNALHAFDAILIVTGDRIAAIDIEIAKQSVEAKKPVVFVRSKADSIIRQIAFDKGIPMEDAAKEFKAKVKDNFKAVMSEAGLKDISIFIVCCQAFYPGRFPYFNGKDKTLQGMEEPLLLNFITEKAGNRFNDQLRAMIKEFSQRRLMAFSG